MSQTAAPLVNMVAGRLGQIAECLSPQHIESKVSAVDQVWGRYVSQSTAQDQAKIPAATGDINDGGLGVVVATQSLESNSSSLPTYLAGKSLPVLRKGKAWVLSTADVTIGGDVFVWHTTSDAGKFTTTTESGNATQLAGARYRSTGTAGNLVLVELNQPSGT